MGAFFLRTLLLWVFMAGLVSTPYALVNAARGDALAAYLMYLAFIVSLGTTVLEQIAIRGKK